MAKQVKQWLMVNDEIFRTDENAMHYLDMLFYSAKHHDIHLHQDMVCKNGKKMPFMTIITDNKEACYKFCAMADKVNGLYCVSDIIDYATRVLDAKSNQE